jgi:hypothetical protein
MNDSLNLIVQELNKFNLSIKNTLNQKNISNTGEAANSLRVEKGIDYGRSLGIFYLEFLDKGRGPGKFPPVKEIRNWVITKLKISDSKQVESITYLVSKKIAKLGTIIFQDNSKGLEIDKKIDVLRKSIRINLSRNVKTDINRKLNKYYKKRILKI